MWPGCRWPHCRQHGVDDGYSAEDVDLELLASWSSALSCQDALVAITGAGDEHVDRTLVVLDVGDRLSDGALVSDVKYSRVGPGVEPLERVRVVGSPHCLHD